MQIRPATANDQAAILGLLQDSNLPVDDLDTAEIDFVVVTDDVGIAGAAGLESFGESGLLRSVAVREGLRGTGIGDQLVRVAEARAKTSGFKHLVLLTQTAAPFFAQRGYAVIARTEAPAAVQQSAEFRSICPASATCMIKSLEP